MDHAFAAARPAAQHCAELTRRGPRPEERAALLAAWRRDLARTLAADLSALLSGDRLEVIVSEPEWIPGHEAIARIGPVAANSLLRCGSGGETVLLSLSFATAIALTDRSFGGEGKLPEGVPDQLPRSAALLVDEAAAMIAQGLTRASLGEAADSGRAPLRGEVMVRSESAARLKPFAPDEPCAFLVLTIASRQGREWSAALAVSSERLDRLLPEPGPASRRPRRRAAAAPAGPAGMVQPFAAIPLPVRVVLAEFDLSLARLQHLAPGDTIPLALARQVPVEVGGTLLAHGSIGTIEDRMAVRLTRFPREGFVP